jgi:hypothetical protein
MSRKQHKVLFTIDGNGLWYNYVTKKWEDNSSENLRIHSHTNMLTFTRKKPFFKAFRKSPEQCVGRIEYYCKKGWYTKWEAER